MRLFLFPAVLAFALSACNGVPLTTQWKLRSYSPATAAVAPLRIAVRGPDWLEPTPETGRVTVGYWRKEEPDAKRALTIRLTHARHDEDAMALASMLGEGRGPVALFEADRRDLAAIRAAQDEARRWKQDGAETAGELKLDGALYCRRSDLPQGPIPFDLFIHADDEIGWLPMLAQYDIHGPGSDEEKLAESLPPCPKSTARIDASKGGK